MPEKALLGRIMRDQFAVHMVFTHAARNELAVLRAEVDHGDGITLEWLGGNHGRTRFADLRCLRFRNLEVGANLDVVGCRYAVAHRWYLMRGSTSG